MGVKLTWDLNAESDMDKYYIYRQVVATGEISKLDEVNHPTHEYEDSGGDSSYRYFVSAVDTNGNESGLAGPVRLPEVSGMCYLYDTLYRPGATGASAASGVNVHVKIVELPYDYEGYFWSGQTITLTTDADGIWALYVPQGATVQVTIEEFGLEGTSGQKTIPSTASVRWGDIP